MSWLSAPEGQEFDHAGPTHDIVERFLRWVPESSLRQAALLAAIPHTFNIDILKLLLNASEHNSDIQSMFDWLLKMPFVQQRSDGWQYHSVVRRLMLRYQRQKSPSAYQHMHTILAEFYYKMRNEVNSSTGDEWKNEEWRASTLAYAYHFLVVDHIQRWDEIISLFGMALRKRRSFAVEIIELLSSDDMHDELSPEQNEAVQLFKQQLEAIQNGDLKDGFEMFNKLCAMHSLSSQAKCYAFAYRGEGYRLSNKWEKALNDFGEALNYFSEDAWTIGSRGQTYRAMKRYEEALADFDRAIALDEKYAGAIGGRGDVYAELERYEEALADFERAIAIDNQSAWIVCDHGLVNLLMGCYPEALTDFDRAIALEEVSYYRHRFYRALVHLVAGQEDAFRSDLSSAVVLAQVALSNTPNDWGIRFDLALCKLASGDKDVEAYYDQLLSTCVLLPYLQEALDDLDIFIKLQPYQEVAQQIHTKLLVYIAKLSRLYTESLSDLS